jgi:glycosyltransferase involved in cell wall biosynthesis
MHVGIITRYKQHEATLAAIRIAEWVLAHGGTVSMFTYEQPSNSPINAYWDTQVQHVRRGAFPQWSLPLTSMVWTHEPSMDEITWAHYKQVPSVVVASWDELSNEFSEVFHLCTAIVAPSMLAAEYFFATGFIQSLAVPWDLGLPQTQKSNDYQPQERIKALLPLHDSQPSRIRPETIQVLTKVLRTCKWVDLTLLVSPSKLRGKVSKQIRKMVRALPGRVTRVTDPGGEKRWLIYGQHDLTIWLSTIESYGLPGLISLAMGTPVIGYGAPIISEILAPARCRRIPGRIILDSKAIPSFIPDLARTEEHLLSLLSDREEIHKMASTTSAGIKRRAESFEHIWPFVLD